MRPTGVLIAAGRSSRFGSDKLLHPLADGTPIALASLRNLKAACAEVVAVLRPEQQALATLLGENGARLIFSEASNKGMGYSLAAGVRGSENANGWLLALADMPFVLPQTIGKVAEALAEGVSIVAPSHLGRRGHPVGFARRWFESLCALDGDTGARHLLDAHAADLQLLPCDDPGVCRDIDTPEDL